MPERRILLTGFEPFAGDLMNPSGEIAKALDGRRLGDCEVRGVVLPVEHEAARAAVLRHLDDPALAAVVHLGLAGGRTRIALERVAVNMMDYSQPDAAGALVRDVCCAADGPEAYFSTLPLREILDALRAAGIPAYVSYSAGTFLCNFTLYSTRHALARRGREVPAGFVHLPFSPEMVVAHDRDEPSMALPLMERAIACALEVISAR